MYKLQKRFLTGEILSVLYVPDNKTIPFDDKNTEYQAYLRWLAEGNEPEQPDEPLPSQQP